MTFRLAMRALLTRPVRSAVLASGFGFGISVMAVLLGVGQVILEQARSPDLHGQGDVSVQSSSGALEQGRFFASSLRGQENLGSRIETISPSVLEELYVVGVDGVRAVRARGGIPSLERALGDAETSRIDTWQDSPRDAEWTAPDPDDLLRALDRFHHPPAIAGFDESWAEWLYFNGRSGDTKFYLSFLYGPEGEGGIRHGVARLQLDRGSGIECFADSSAIDARELLESAPEITLGGSSVRIENGTYRIRLALFKGACEGGPANVAFEKSATHDLVGELTLGAALAKAMPPFTLRGARKWLSGYVVPVLEGPLDGRLTISGSTVSIAGGTGYHDHNWGFWKGVTWQWGQVAGDGISIVYGRVHPPREIAEPERAPAFLGVIGPGGPLGFSSTVTIEESESADGTRPETIRIEAAGPAFELDLSFVVESVARTRLDPAPGAEGRPSGVDFLQLQGTYDVRGRVGELAIEFESAGSAETFRGR